MATPTPLTLHLLGEMRISRGGEALELPPSRKTRALLAYLALSPGKHLRESLCGLIWDGPNDPRAALRWSLSKLKPLLSGPDFSALTADRQGVELMPERVTVDVLQIRRALEDDDGLDDATLAGFDAALEGGCLPGLDDVGGAELQLWLGSEREAVRRLHREVLDRFVERADGAEAALPRARKRLALDPLHTPSNLALLELTLSTAGRDAAKKLLDQACARYRDQALSDHALRAAWAAMSNSGSALEVSAPSEPAPAPDPAADTASLPDKPSVAVLSFRDLGGHDAGAVLATGLSVDLTSRLSQLPQLFVSARASAARLSGQALTPSEIGRLLGVRYLVDGTAQRSERRVRVTVSLLDASEQSELWSERFDRSLDDLFEVQDDITSAVVSAIEPAIERAEMARSILLPPGSLSAWESYHRGLWHCFRFTAKDNELAHRMLTRAAELDPHFSRAYAGLSFTHYSRAFLDAAESVPDEIARSLEHSRHAVDLDGRDAMGHWALGRALFLSREHDQALGAIDRALATNPSYAQAHYARGFIGIHSGLDEASIPALARAERLSPFDPLLFAMKGSRGLALANQGRHEDAAAWAIRATQEPNAHFHMYAIAAACLELAGRSAEAKNNARWALERHPGYSVQVFQQSFPHKDESYREPVLAALERAGIPR